MELYPFLTMLLVAGAKLLHLQAQEILIKKQVLVPTCTPLILGSTMFPCSERLSCPEMPPDEPNPGSWIKKNCVDPTLPTVLVTPQLIRSNTVCNHTLNEGENITMTCNVNRFQRFNNKFIIKWTKRDKESDIAEPIFSSNMENTSNSHRSFSMAYNVENQSVIAQVRIFQLGPNDAGLYECVIQQISGIGSFFDKQAYTVTVRYPAKVWNIGPQRAPFWNAEQPGLMYVNETDNITLTCSADGVPTPTISWRIDGNPAASIKITGLTNADGSLYIPRITRNYTGKYICSARNGITTERPSSKPVEVDLVVQYPPQPDRSYEERKVGASLYVRLEGRFKGLPIPTYTWFKNGKPLSTIYNRSEAVAGRDLVIILLDPSKHYANYTCVATNMLGSANITFDVNGRPYPPKIVNSTPYGRRRRSFEVYWLPGNNTEKDIPVTTYSILYRRVEIKTVGSEKKVNYYPSDTPNSVTVPGDITRYYLTELKENSTYEIAVCPSNAYGTGKCANYTFFTPNDDIIITPTVNEETENQSERSPPPQSQRVSRGGSSGRTTPSLGCLLTMVTLALFKVSTNWILHCNENT